MTVSGRRRRGEPPRKDSKRFEGVFDPRGLKPREFFEEFLPQKYREAAKVIPDIKSFPVSVRFVLEGEGGGAWHMKLSDGKAEVHNAGGGRTEASDILIKQSVDDWRDLIDGEIGIPKGTPVPQNAPQLIKDAPPGLLALDDVSREIIKKLKGYVIFIISGHKGRDWKTYIRFGGEACDSGPGSTIKIQSETLKTLDVTKFNPQALFMNGGLEIGGDFVLPSQMATLFLNKMRLRFGKN